MKPYYQDDLVTLYHGTAAAVALELEPASVRTIVTSPPYFGLRDYGSDEQIGSEATLDEYVDALVRTFRALRPALTDDGTVWLNLGDSFANDGKWGGSSGGKHVSALHGKSGIGRGKVKTELAPKNLIGVPWRVAFALQADGWILRSDIVWAKPNPMPESVTDRPTRSHEFLFLFAKSPKYFYDAEAISETATGQASGNGFARPESISRGGRGQEDGWQGRPQLRRALQIAAEHGLTEDHFAAIRAVGMSDAGKARVTQAGSGRNDPEMQRLANEAKEKLGGYYREFLVGGTKNKRDVWTVSSQPFSGAHFATYPSALIRPCILAGSARGNTVLDPFSGSGTTGMVATHEGRRYIGIDVNAEYLDLSLRERFADAVLDMTGGAA